MRRVVIAQEYIPDYRVPFFKQLMQGCHAEGIDLRVAAGAAAGSQALRGDSRPDGVLVTPLRQREYRIANKRVTLRSLASASKNADLLVIEQARRNLDAYCLLRPRATWPAQRIAMWGHGRDYVKSATHLEARLTATLTRRVDHFFAYTEGGAHYVRQLGVDRERISVVQNTIDSEALRADLQSVSSEEVAVLRAEHGLTEHTLLYVGGLDPSKRITFLLHAFELAHKEDPRLRLLLIGDGEQRDLVRQESLRNPAIVWLGRRAGRAKAVAFRASRALVVPGRVGLVAVESLVSGLSLLTTDWNGHAPEIEYLTPGKSLLTSQDDPRDYAQLMHEVSRRLTAAHLVERDRRAAASKFSIEVMADNFLEGILAALDRS